MKCKNCGHDPLKVKSTEKFDTVNRRILVCPKCGWAVGTEETFIEAKPKNSGNISMPSSI